MEKPELTAMTGTAIHVRNNANYSFTDDETDPHTVTQQFVLPVAAPGFWWTLVRTRLMIEFRIFAYSVTDSVDVPALWYRELYPVVGVEAIVAAEAQGSGSLPMGGEEGTDWVIWEGLSGSPDIDGKSPGGFYSASRVWKPQNHFLDSHAKRAPAEGTQVTVLLAWEWNDPEFIINHSHETFDDAYDLNITWAMDCFFQPTPH